MKKIIKFFYILPVFFLSIKSLCNINLHFIMIYTILFGICISISNNIFRLKKLNIKRQGVIFYIVCWYFILLLIILNNVLWLIYYLGIAFADFMLNKSGLSEE